MKLVVLLAAVVLLVVAGDTNQEYSQIVVVLSGMAYEGKQYLHEVIEQLKSAPSVNAANTQNFQLLQVDTDVD